MCLLFSLPCRCCLPSSPPVPFAGRLLSGLRPVRYPERTVVKPVRKENRTGGKLSRFRGIARVSFGASDIGRPGTHQRNRQSSYGVSTVAAWFVTVRAPNPPYDRFAIRRHIIGGRFESITRQKTVASIAFGQPILRSRYRGPTVIGLVPPIRSSRVLNVVSAVRV